MEKLGLKYTTWDAKNGVYLYQRILTGHLIDILQKKVVKVSLGSTPHEARARYLAVHTKWEGAIQRALESLRGEPEDDAEVERMVRFMNAEAARDGGTLREIDWELNWGERDTLWDRWAEWNLTQHRIKTGHHLDGDNDMVLDRLVETNKVFRAALKIRVNLSAQLPAPLAHSNMPAETGEIRLSMSQVEERWLNEKKRRATNIGDMKRMVSVFVAVNGNLPMREIAAFHQLAFRDHIQQLDIKPQSKNKLLRTISALGGYAHGIGAVTTNPLKFRFFQGGEETARESYEDEDLNKIFRSVVYKKRSQSDRKYANFIKWFFRLAPHTGARIGELAQLRAEDVYQHHGTWCIQLTNDEQTGQSTKGKKTKLVPVAKGLINLGFLKFVKKVKTGQLFPEVIPSKDGIWSHRVSKEVNDVIRGNGFSKAYVAHGFRHTLKTRLRTAGVIDTVSDFITHPGGKKSSIGAKYGKVEVAAMKKAVDALNYKVSWPTS
jgi:integrase